MLFIAMTALLLGSLAVLGIQSFSISGQAALYPQVLIGTGFVLLLVSSMQSWRRRASVEPDAELASLGSGRPSTRILFILFCLIWVAYPLLMPYFGFTATTVLAFYGSSMLFGNRRRVASLLWVVVFAVVFAVLLKTVIYVPVPEAWPDRLINSIIYRF